MFKLAFTRWDVENFTELSPVKIWKYYKLHHVFFQLHTAKIQQHLLRYVWHRTFSVYGRCKFQYVFTDIRYDFYKYMVIEYPSTVRQKKSMKESCFLLWWKFLGQQNIKPTDFHFNIVNCKIMRWNSKTKLCLF